MKHDTLANLVASRICHDLINPIGATHNGIELLWLDPNVPKGLEFDMINSSVEDAKSRVEFCRLVFGTAASDIDVHTASFQTLLSKILDNKRYQISWSVPERMHRIWAKRLGLSILCIEQQMPRGAQFTVTPNQIVAETSLCRDILPQWDHVTNAMSSQALHGHDVQFAVLGDVIRHDPAVVIDLQPKRVALRLD